jgi:hypothetical protein
MNPAGDVLHLPARLIGILENKKNPTIGKAKPLRVIGRCPEENETA